MSTIEIRHRVTLRPSYRGKTQFGMTRDKNLPIRCLGDCVRCGAVLECDADYTAWHLTEEEEIACEMLLNITLGAKL